MCVAAFVALVVAAVFGAGDQYLGSLSAHPWAADVSLLSAPWFAIAFLAGATQQRPRNGALLGFSCTICALAGYGIMTLSPVENAHLTTQTVRALLVSESGVIVGGVFTAPCLAGSGIAGGRDERGWEP